MRERLSEGNRFAFDRLRAGRWGRYTDASALCRDHFRLRSESDHVNYASFAYLVELMGGRPQTILETGVSAWGTDSTRLFDSYTRSFGGSLWSVDIDGERVERLRRHVASSTTLGCDDSVAFLERWVVDHPDARADVVYLDSFDVDFSDPLPAAEHCLREVQAVLPALKAGALLLIDDSPACLDDVPENARASASTIFAEFGAWPGKGMLAQRFLANRGVTPIRHGYQALYRM
jgi:predicted O-methyltransferase YrrM